LPTARIAQIVSVEPLVATKLMHMANSVLYSPDGTPARNLQAAISRLGVELVRTTALAIAMNQLIRSKDMAIFNDLTQSLWDHTIKTAAAARVLARTYTRINPDEALLAGLVHDLGAFYMVYRAAQYAELRARPDTVKYLIMQWHESIGVTLLHALGVSEEVVNATIDHDQPRAVPTTVRTLAEIIYVGSVLDDAYCGRVRQDGDPAASETAIARQNFAEVLPKIDADAQAMHAVFV
jgi:putative nucleotidyltransferase with HDIG domain